METECSLPHSQEPATCPYPEPDQFSPCSPIPLLAKSFHTIPPATPEMYYGHFGCCCFMSSGASNGHRSLWQWHS